MAGGREQELRVSGNTGCSRLERKRKWKGEGGIEGAGRRVEVVSARLGKGVLIDSRLGISRQTEWQRSKGLISHERGAVWNAPRPFVDSMCLEHAHVLTCKQMVWHVRNLKRESKFERTIGVSYALYNNYLASKLFSRPTSVQSKTSHWPMRWRSNFYTSRQK